MINSFVIQLTYEDGLSTMNWVKMQMDWEAADMNVLRFITELLMRYVMEHI